ncbi:MAG: dihydroorotate dehydrogenase [Clostridiales Family XIII bacterium]|jgi:dihydroorotate dehydrogenase (NAD+) catalytic subunit|nr:dihydroorotate dehydrogenase [Clostridiales Family XIII bacterium]
MNKLETVIGKIKLRNPVLCASGCFGYGYEAARFTTVSKIGAVSYKTFTPNPKNGNPPPRIHEVPAGVMTSIGLQNPGYEVFVNDIYPKSLDTLRPDQRIVSIAGDSAEEYVALAVKLSEILSSAEIAALEVNAACPNVSLGGVAFASRPSELNALLKDIIKRVPFPVIAKFTTLYDNYCDAAKAIEDAGAQAVYTANTPIGMAIDVERGLPVMGNLKAPISGPAIRPIGVCRTWDIYKSVKIPIIASGGIICCRDALEYMMAGASAVSIGCANFAEPNTAVAVTEGLASYVNTKKLSNISEIVGLAHKNSAAPHSK